MPSSDDEQAATASSRRVKPETSNVWSVMMQSDTPKTRAPQFSHLKGKELYHAVKELPLWIMMQEFSPLFSTKEVTLQWLVDVQGINPHINRTKIDTDPIRTAMTKYGFPLSNYREPGLRGAYSQMWKTSSDNVKTILIFLRDMAPTANLAATNGIGSPTSATGRATRCTVANVILQMDGPVGEELIVAGPTSTLLYQSTALTCWALASTARAKCIPSMRV